MHEYDVSALFALRVIDSPEPATLMGQDFGALVQYQFLQASSALAGFVGGFLKRNEDAAFNKLSNNAWAIYQDDRILSRFVLLIHRRFCEARQRDEVGRN
jgi:hypothetical protein